MSYDNHISFTSVVHAQQVQEECINAKLSSILTGSKPDNEIDSLFNRATSYLDAQKNADIWADAQ